MPAQLTQCKDCTDLIKLLKRVDCTLLRDMTAKRASERFGVKSAFSVERYSTLIHLRRILHKRSLNSDYLPGTDLQDIYTLVSRVTTDDACCQCETLNAVAPATTRVVPTPTPDPTPESGENFIWTGNIL